MAASREVLRSGREAFAAGKEGWDADGEHSPVRRGTGAVSGEVFATAEDIPAAGSGASGVCRGGSHTTIPLSPGFALDSAD
jgi:hypothetical protein